MTCSLYRATAADLDRLLADPAAVQSFIESIEGPALPVRQVRPKGILGFLLRLTPITIEEVVPESERAGTPPSAPHHPDRGLDIEKAWHGLHFLFTGTSDGGEEPACYLVHGGEALDDEGYGRALRPAQVQSFASFLASLTPDELRGRYDPARMVGLEIYPDSIWDDDTKGKESPRDWLIKSFGEVQAFVARAAAAGDGMVVHIS
jgi:hypothetical protein